MLADTLPKIFDRDLHRLSKEIESYTSENTIWKVEGQVPNSAGNLCLHLIGNLNTYIGKEIGGVDYIRDREAEFTLKNISRAELLRKIDDTISVVRQSLERLDENDLEKEYPILVFEEKTTTEYFLVHLATHLAYHLGQINYHRRLIDSGAIGER